MGGDINDKKIAELDFIGKSLIDDDSDSLTCIRNLLCSLMVNDKVNRLIGRRSLGRNPAFHLKLYNSHQHLKSISVVPHFRSLVQHFGKCIQNIYLHSKSTKVKGKSGKLLPGCILKSIGQKFY